MKTTTRLTGTAALLLLASHLCLAGPSNEEIDALIKQAMPAKTTAAPHKPRKLLVFSLCQGPRHEAIDIAQKALVMMGETTGAYTAVASVDMAMFDADKLAQFDGVLFNNTTNLKFENPEQRTALMAFVKSVKGVIGIHAAADNFQVWPEAGEMMGGYFDGHPWTADGTWAVKIDDPTHPLNRSFKGKGFAIKDEIYQIRGPYSRSNQRVLLSLDMADARNQKVNGINRADKDFAIAWIKPWGKGRVFYCSLGHNPELYWNPAVLQHYLAGIQYALGDLKANDAPLPKKDAPAA
jgi:type 1 glutamine amidotransferase